MSPYDDLHVSAGEIADYLYSLNSQLLPNMQQPALITHGTATTERLPGAFTSNSHLGLLVAFVKYKCAIRVKVWYACLQAWNNTLYVIPLLIQLAQGVLIAFACIDALPWFVSPFKLDKLWLPTWPINPESHMPAVFHYTHRYHLCPTRLRHHRLRSQCH
jgi:hypothetical protein